MKRDEADFKKWFRSHYDWSMTIEPALGTGVGMPDVALLGGGIPWREIKLVELKVGEWLGWSDKLLAPKKIRPSQINWHHRFAEAGGESIIVVGTFNHEEDRWEPWRIPSDNWRVLSNGAKRGFPEKVITLWQFPEK